MRWACGLAVLAMTAFLAPAAQADKRVALVVGVANYRSVQALRNPTNDARLIAQALRDDGFTLVGDGPQTDLDHAGFERALRSFAALSQGADVALFYYSGHGAQVLDTNWLLPTDADPQKPADLLSEGVDVAEVLKILQLSEARLNVLLLDACRNDPFLERGLRAPGGSGLMRMDAPDGTVISYATKPGHTALDGSGDDSPYSTALAQVLHEAGLPVLSMFNRLGLAVQRSTQGAQQPWLSASPIDEQLTFGPAAAPGEAAAPAVVDSGFVAPEPPAADANADVKADAGAAKSGIGDAAATSVPPSARTTEPAQPEPPAPPPAPPSGPVVAEWVEQTYVVAHGGAVRGAPSDTADAVGQLGAGATVFVVGQLQDSAWLQVRLPERQTPAYLRVADVPAVTAPSPPAPAPAAPSPRPLSGFAEVHDTATLLVEDRVARLAGIEGFSGPLADGLQDYLNHAGGFAVCERVDERAGPGTYHCVTRDGVDLASVALVNGAAKMLPGAPPDYAVQQEDAQRNGRGIWAAAAPDAPPPDPLPPGAYVEAADAVEDLVVPGPVVVAPDPADYGLAVIDGEPVTVIDGARVLLEFDLAEGWGWHDGARHWHDAPPDVRRALDRRYPDRVPPDPGRRITRRLAVDDAARPQRLGLAARGRGSLQEAAYRSVEVRHPEVAHRLPGVLPRPEPLRPGSAPPRPEPQRPEGGPARPEAERPGIGPARPEPVHPEPTRPEAGHPEPVHPEPGHPEPGHPEPGHPEPGHPEPGRPGPPGTPGHTPVPGPPVHRPVTAPAPHPVPSTTGPAHLPAPTRLPTGTPPGGLISRQSPLPGGAGGTYISRTQPGGGMVMPSHVGMPAPGIGSTGMVSHLPSGGMPFHPQGAPSGGLGNLGGLGSHGGPSPMPFGLHPSGAPSPLGSHTAVPNLPNLSHGSSPVKLPTCTKAPCPH